MGALVETLASLADIVIFDSPPVLAVTDAAVLARQVDGVLLVVDAGRTKEHALAAAAAEIEKTGGNLLGVALNRLDVRRGYNYYYYYYYTEDEGGEKKGTRQRRAEGPRLRLPWQKPA
jgi:Mrp family chromosome partitioning ATPase